MFKCEKCGQDFTTKRGLKMHSRRWCSHDDSEHESSSETTENEGTVDSTAGEEVKEFADVPVASKFSMLVVEAEMEMDKLGHAPGPCISHGNSGEISCVLCRKKVYIAECPPPGGKNIAGPMLDVECRRHP